MTSRSILMLLGYAALSANPAAAQQLEKLTTEVSILIGKSGNVLILPGPGGALIVDTQRETDSSETMAAVNQAGSRDVRYAINTHWHLDHSGGNSPLAAAGAIIISHHNVKMRRSTEQYMTAYNRRIPAGNPEALPTLTFNQELDIQHGSETVELRHAPFAHTDGDTIVKLRQANVLHLGDLFFNGYFPFIDRDSGGGVEGLISAIDQSLAMSNSETKIVPGHGPIASQEELQSYRAMLHAYAGNIRKGIAEGRSRQEIIDSEIKAPYGAGLQGNGSGFIGAIYDSLIASGPSSVR